MDDRLENNLEVLLDWLKEWREKHGIEDTGTLSETELNQFVAELQEKIVNIVEDFGPVPGYEDAKLVLYSDVDYKAVEKYCTSSQGKYYMINQTKLDFFWDEKFKQNVANVIGEKNPKSPITARVLEGKEYYSADGNSCTRIGNTATESGNYLALDDFLSSQVAKTGARRGNVEYLIGENASKDSVGLLSEIPSVINEIVLLGKDISSSLTIGTNFTKLSDGTFHYDFLNVDDASVFLNKNGTVDYIDIWGKADDSIIGIKTTYGKYCEELKNAMVYIGENGDVVGYSYKGIEGAMPDNYVYETRYDIFSKYLDDATMLEKYGDLFGDSSSLEKIFWKELDYYYRAIIEGTVESETRALAISNYLKGSKKQLSELNDIDKTIIRMFENDKIVNSGFVKLVTRLSEKPGAKKLFTGLKYGTAALGTIFTGVMIYQTTKKIIPKVQTAIDKGDYFEASGIIAGEYSDLAITLWGGTNMFGTLSPYFMGAGMTFAGPPGAVVGFLLAGVVSFATSSIVGDMFDWFCKETGKLLDNLYSGACEVYHYIMGDPLVLDFDGDGFEILSVKDGVYFDTDARGLVEKGEWIAADDALLAIDLNGDGIINDGRELFGTSTFLADGTTAKDGFSALAQYDINQDGVIDEQDEVFGKLKVWQDRNSDGISQESEIFSMSDLGLQSISLDRKDEDGHNVANVVFSDGTSKKMGEFNFEADYYDTIERENISISEEISCLPDIQAMGDIPSLHTIMQLDNTGTIKSYVEAFAKTSNRTEKETIVTKILYSITGADSTSDNSRGYEFDAKKLTVIEKYMGRSFVGTAGANPVDTAASILEKIYYCIENSYYCMLNAQTHLKPYLEMTCWETDQNGRRTLNTEYFDVFVKMCKEQGHDLSDIVADVAFYIKSINLSNGDDFIRFVLKYSNDKEYLKAITDMCYTNGYLGTEDNDYYEGTSLDDALIGEGGDDTLYARCGDDFIVGGKGDDYLSGERGDDTYFFNIGDGKDTIREYQYDEVLGKSDMILFGEGIHPEDIKMYTENSNIIIQYSDNDRIIIDGCFDYNDDRAQVEIIEFADGTVWNKRDIAVRCNTRYGTEKSDTIYGMNRNYNEYDPDETFYAGAGDDYIYGQNGNDTMYGEAGEDHLYGEYGDDILIGGEGNDVLDGGYGDDTYLFKLGDGEDTIREYQYDSVLGKSDRIVLEEEIRPEEINVYREGDNIVIRYSDNDQITVENCYGYRDDRSRVEELDIRNNALYRINYNDVCLDLLENYENSTSACSSNDVDILVNDMTNLAIQEMSDVNGNNVSEVNFSSGEQIIENSQLWVE